MREKMKLAKVKWLALGLLLAAAVGAGASAQWSHANAQVILQYPGPRECNADYSARSLAGCFGWQSTAFVNYSTAQATAAIGLMHLDGAGNVKGWYSGSFVGNATVRNYEGKYWVNPNGTGHLWFEDLVNGRPRHDYDFVIVEGSNTVFMSSTLNDGTIQNIEMKRQ